MHIFLNLRINTFMCITGVAVLQALSMPSYSFWSGVIVFIGDYTLFCCMIVMPDAP